MRKLVPALLLCLLLCSCDKTYEPSTGPEFKDYGGGVLYFPYIRDNFGNALSAYIRQRPGKRVVSVVEDGTNAYGASRGYFVIVEDR